MMSFSPEKYCGLSGHVNHLRSKRIVMLFSSQLQSIGVLHGKGGELLHMYMLNRATPFPNPRLESYRHTRAELFIM